MPTTSRLAVLTWAVPGAALLALVAGFALTPAPSGADLLLGLALAAATAAAELAPVRVAPNQKASLASVPMLLAVLLLPPPAAGLAGALGVLGGNLLVGRRYRPAAFNAGSATLATLAGATLAWGARPDAVGAGRMLAGALVFSLVAYSLASAAAALQRSEPVGSRLVATLSTNWSQAVAFAAIAVCMAALARTSPALTPLPLLFLPLIFRMNVALEAELSANERLQEVLAGQRRFLTDVSHNVGNPLATIRTNLALLGKASLRPSQRVSLRDAASESARLAELFKRLRVLAETDEGLPLKRQRFDLAEVANDLVRAYTGEAVQRGVELTCEVAAAVEVDGDEELLRQAAANLVENAIRLTPSGRAVRLRVEHQQRISCLEVIDEGPGIAEEDVSSIFERFRKGPGGGSGLGLSIARSVVERHGGRIWVDTRLGAGSRFQIRLPAAN